MCCVRALNIRETCPIIQKQGLPGGGVGAGAAGGRVFETPKVLRASEESPAKHARRRGTIIAAACFRHHISTTRHYSSRNVLY